MPGGTALALVAVISKLALRASGYSDSADAIADVMDARRSLAFVKRIRKVPFHQQISRDLDDFRKFELSDLDAYDWEAACVEVTEVLERHGRTLDALVDPRQFLRSVTQAGEARRRSLGGEAAQAAFDRLLAHAVNQLARFVRTSPQFQEEATTRLLQESSALIGQVERVQAGQDQVARDVQALLAGARFGLISFATYAESRLRTDPSLLLGEHVGRTAELTCVEHWGLAPQGRRALLVSAPGGRGKTRLCTEALLRITATAPALPIWVIEATDALNGHVLAQLDRPCIVFIDDAHRHPHLVDQLVKKALSNSGLRLLLSARPQAVDRLERSVIAQTEGAFSLDVLALARLTQAEARALVDTLLVGSDYEAPNVFRSRLIRQASKEPYLSVHAIDLFRQGKLTGPLAVHKDLRTRVLARHFDQRLPVVDGVSRPQVQRLLAGVHALSKAAGDLGVITTAALDYAHVGHGMRNALTTELEASGLLERVNDRLEVVPEIVGDYAMEIEAGFDASAFMRDMWRQLSPVSEWPVFISLCALDWRLQEQGQAGGIDLIWHVLADHLAEASWGQVAQSLAQLQEAPQIQPHRFAEALFEVVDRALHDMAASQIESDLETDSNVGDAARFFAEPRALEVATSCIPLLCECATAEPRLLLRVLDVAWRVASHPVTGTPSGGAVIDTLVERLVRLTDVTGRGPDMLVVAAWTHQAATTADQKYLHLLLPVCKALMRKTERYTEMVDETHVMWGSRLASPSQTCDARDEIRAMAAENINRVSNRAAAELLKALVESAGRATQGSDIRDPEAARQYEAAWEDDDLTTLNLVALLLHEGNLSPAVRRLTRHELAGLIGRTGTDAVGLRALEIVTQLDNMEGDDWVQILLASNIPPFRRRQRSRRGIPLPTLETYAKEQRIRPHIDTEFTSLRRAAEDAMRSAAQLFLTLDTHTGLRTLRAAAEDIVATAGTAQVHTFVFWQQVATVAPPGRAAELTQALAKCPRSYIDSGVSFLMRAWLTTDDDGFFTWLETHIDEMRTSLRGQAARALTSGGTSDPRRAPLLDALLADGDQNVRDEAVQTLADEIRDSPTSALTRLLAARPTQYAAHAVLDSVSHDLPAWVDGLDEDGRSRAFALLDAVGLEAPNLTRLAIALLAHDPARIIRICLTHHQPYGSDADPELLRRLGDHPAEALELALDSDPLAVAPLISQIIALPLAEDARRRFAAQLSGLDVGAFTDALSALSSLNNWPLRDPELALAVLASARHLTSYDQRSVHHLIVRAMGPSSWSIDRDGRSDEFDYAIDLAQGILKANRYAPLHEDTRAALQRIDALKHRARKRWDD